jgi:hypothetical protein
VHRVSLVGEGLPAVVLKRFPPATGAPELEWQALCFAEHASVPSLEPLAFDPDGDWFRTPATVMSALPGRLSLTPTDPDRSTAELFAAATAPGQPLRSICT